MSNSGTTTHQQSSTEVAAPAASADMENHNHNNSNSPPQSHVQQEPVNFSSTSNNTAASRRVTIGGGMHGGGGSSSSPAADMGDNNTNMNNKNNDQNKMNPPNSTQQQQQQQSSNNMGGGGVSQGSGGGGQFPPPPQQQPPNMGMMDRRGSMSSAAYMDDFFGRRPSMGFDAMDLFGRRDSMDSTTAALDAAIMDLSQRRYSTAMGARAAAASMDPMSSHDSISQRQQQLQQQQRELEQRQKELEYQRRQLIASMQERSYSGGYGGGGHHGHHQQHPPYPMSNRGSMGMGSLGMGSVQSQGSLSGGHPVTAPPPPMHRGSGGSGSGNSGSTQWWICQVCNSKAFASHEEAMQHEDHCRLETSQRSSSSRMDPLPIHGHHDPMHSRYSMGYGGGMDNSQRSYSMGMGMGMNMGMGGMGTTPMDNSARGIVSMGMDSSRGNGSLGMDSSRNMSMGMDSSSGTSYTQERTMSMGPFAMLSEPMALSMPSDKDWLTPLHCFVRRNCVEVFTATEADVATPSKGKRKPIQVGQVGIRCPHCHKYDADGNKARERGSVYYPTSISSIYNATMNLLQRHLHNCPAVPDEIMRRYETLKADDARSGTSKRYWIESALSLGLVDTNNGIRHSALRPPPLPSLTRQQESTLARRNSNEFFSTKSNAMAEMKDASNNSSKAVNSNESESKKDGDGEEEEVFSKNGEELTETAPLVTPDDKPYATTFSYHLLSQMQPCVFTEADRLGKRKGLPPGFPGLACRHCFGGYGSGRFFPSSIKTLSDTSKTLNVLHNHMMRCRKCPSEVKENLEKLRGSHDEERAKMKFGSQKAFFARIWERLHGKDHPGSFKRQTTPRRNSPNKRNNNNMMAAPMPVGPYGSPPPMMHHHHHHHNSGLDALAAVSSPSKRQKMDI